VKGNEVLIISVGWDEVAFEPTSPSPSDLKSLQEIVIEEQGKSLVVRTECKGTCGKVFQSVGIAIPPTIREIS